WDLDQTLWDGVLGEDGVEVVKIRPQAVQAIKALDRRGVLQSIASKNDPAEALAALRRFELDSFFLHPQISWRPKSEAVAAIAAALDIGLDTVAFIDDQAFERAEVSSRLAGVRTLPETAVGELMEHPWFDHPRTAESGRRRSLYAAEAARTAARDAAIGEYIDFLKASRISLEIRPLGEADIERAFELSQRTNQLNFTGEKFSRSEVHALLADPGVELLVLNCADRFGDYGMIGLAAIDLEGAELTQFFMSCRVQRRRVECAFFAFLAKRLRTLKRVRMAVRFRATERNGAAAMMLRELGFRQGEADSAGWSRWERPLRAPVKDADVVRISGAFGKAA
ncbi:MAG: HAD-IIIC family phosphatase, partial [Caulobacteraceae bacterium]